METHNPSLLWASLLVEECIRHGADTFFIAPGARCTPLTLAIARHPDAQSLQHFDERGLAFAALGYARATGRPGVVVCTSGTAVSNLTPAVVEAWMDHVPMVLLTADRPFELRDCGANQSIPQTRAFAGYTCYATDLPVPTPAVPPQVLLTTLDAALHASLQGPVHLNCPFREPFMDEDPAWDVETYLEPLQSWNRHKDPYTSNVTGDSSPSEIELVSLAELLEAPARVLVIAGGGGAESDGLCVLDLCRQKGWPVISDLCSGLHFGPDREGVIRHVDAWIPPAGFPEDLMPEVVLQFGCRFLSKSLLQALKATDLKAWLVISPYPGRFDPLHKVTHRVQASVSTCCRALGPLVPGTGDPSWCQRWQEADQTVASRLSEELTDPAAWSEPAVVYELSSRLPDLHGLVIGASMPVRDMNQFAAPNPRHIHVISNRGASGIDGTLATAAGFAQGLGQAVTVVLGDLAALHDLNSLALVAQSPVPVIVIVLNNRGGGIFHFLPQRQDPQFEKYFGTPHTWRFEGAARQFDLPYVRVEDAGAFVAAYDQALKQSVPRVIEVVSDREENFRIHQALSEQLSLAAGVNG